MVIVKDSIYSCGASSFPFVGLAHFAYIPRNGRVRAFKLARVAKSL
jgi:GTP cyclohydrolase I